MDRDSPSKRRRAPRAPIAVPVSTASTGIGITRDISTGGVYVQLTAFMGNESALPAINDILDLKFALPGAFQVQVSGKVVRVDVDPFSERPQGIGIEFATVSEAAIRAIQSYTVELLGGTDNADHIPPPPTQDTAPIQGPDGNDDTP